MTTTPEPTPPTTPEPTAPTPPAGPDVATLLAEREQLVAELNDRKLAEAITTANQMVRLVDPDDLLRYVERSELLDADGAPNVDRVTAAMSKLAAERPWLRAHTPPAPGSADGGRQGALTMQLRESDLAHMSPDAIVRAQRMGLLDQIQGLR